MYLLRTRPTQRTRLSPLTLSSSGIIAGDSAIALAPTARAAEPRAQRGEHDDVVAGPYELNELLDERQCACVSITSCALSLTSSCAAYAVSDHVNATATGCGSHALSSGRHARLYLLIRATCVPDNVPKSALLQPSHIAINLLRFKPTSLPSERYVYEYILRVFVPPTTSLCASRLRLDCRLALE